ncbi:MAG: DUF2752 domain-containing protein [Chitinophagia bacterium]|nr:DUF2752 domain-containing protein [Chitinophagia bacterium]
MQAPPDTMMKKSLNQAWLFALMAFPVLLWILPATFFDFTGIELCPSMFFFDIECLGCGITRAVMHMHHFDWREAVYYNYAVVLVYPALVYVWFLWLRDAWRKTKPEVGKTELEA